MSVVTPLKKVTELSKVHNSEYIRTENKPNDAGAEPTKPADPEQPEAK